MVHECGKWLEYLPEGADKCAEYVMSRLSQFIDYGHEIDHEREISISRASTVGKNAIVNTPINENINK